MIRSFLTGIASATRNWKMIFLLLSANILFSLPVVVPVFLLILQTAGGTPAANRMLANKLDLNWLTDLFNHQMPGYALESIGIQVATLLAVMGLSYLLLNTFFSGGIITVFGSDDGHFTAKKLWSGCGAYFWRFFRLMLISLIFYGGAILIYALIRRAIDKAAAQSAAYEPVFYGKWAVILLLILLLAFVNMVFDYARISTVVNDNRRMFRETVRAIRFSSSYFFKTFGLYLLIAITGIVLFGLLAWLRGSLNQSSAATVFLAIVLGQLAIAARIWTRLTFYAAELDLYRRLNPKPQPVIAPAMEVEFAAATAARASVHSQGARETAKAESEDKEGL